ncbi:Alpha/Beta hydrolase protein, partial [Suillus cothurnatus]
VGPPIGRGKAFDPNRFFIFCANVMGSPYGSASPVTINPDTGKPYGPEFPQTSIRDDVRLHKLVLDHLGVSSVAVAIGGSMGGMAVLEWPLCCPPGYVRHIIPLATSARHSAGVSVGERHNVKASILPLSQSLARVTPLISLADKDLAAHNEGHNKVTRARPQTQNSAAPSTPHSPTEGPNGTGSNSPPLLFSAQSYLRYQGAKFVARFDANCYIHITRKMDTHDVARGRTSTTEDHPSPTAQSTALARLSCNSPPACIGDQCRNGRLELATHIPDAELVVIPSPDGHDGFLLEFEQINTHVLRFLRREIFPTGDFAIKKTSLFGEAEADITRW